MALLEMVLLGTMTVTSYRAVPEQTKPECLNYYHCRTAIDENVNEGGVAVSQDLLQSGVLRYGDHVYVEGIGIKRVNDTMNVRLTRSVDVFVRRLGDEKRINVRHVRIWKIGGLHELQKLSKQHKH